MRIPWVEFIVVGEGAAPSAHANMAFPGLLRPRRTAGATRHESES